MSRLKLIKNYYYTDFENFATGHIGDALSFCIRTRNVLKKHQLFRHVMSGDHVYTKFPVLLHHKKVRVFDGSERNGLEGLKENARNISSLAKLNYITRRTLDKNANQVQSNYNPVP